MPVHWAVELTQFTLAAYYFMGGPITLKNDEHVRMDLWYSTRSHKGKAKIDLAMSVCLIFYLGVLLAGAFRASLCDRDQRKTLSRSGTRRSSRSRP
nr:TRAP transporter small permease subunit [Rhizobium sp. ACO-34A]